MNKTIAHDPSEITVALLYGGKSNERNISILSGTSLPKIHPFPGPCADYIILPDTPGRAFPFVSQFVWIFYASAGHARSSFFLIFDRFPIDRFLTLSYN